MIRDPSDGSVRELNKPEARIPVSETRVIDPTTSGLQTGSEKPENLARLEKSREWLKNYLHRKTEGTSK